jgi:hypothetical protein
MARTPDNNFQPFITRTLLTGNKTTEELYTLARSRRLSLTRSRRKDSSRPSQFAWQHQLRRDQYSLASQGVIERFNDGTWGLTGLSY